MVIDSNTTKTILDLVKLKPRTIQELSEKIKKNWRTTERYVEKIEKETGSISTRIFRGGTRGALKVVYWNGIEDIHSTSFQQELVEDILRAKRKHEFSPFDIFQFVDEKNKKVFVSGIENENWDSELAEKTDFAGFLRKTEKQLLVFSGNLSWVNAKQGETKIIDVVKELVKKDISIKITARVSIAGADNVKKLLAINKEIGKDLIEIRHRYQPLRGMIIDNKTVKLREEKNPEYYRQGELEKEIIIFYDINDKEWIDWLQKVFWKMFSTAIPAEKRLKEIEKMKIDFV